MKILPLPVKKNKHGELVANLSVDAYYRQIMEEVMEAHKAAIIHGIKEHMYFDDCGVCIEYVGRDNEVEGLADVITCCITRLYFKDPSLDIKDFYSYVGELLARSEKIYAEPKDFYTDLAFTVMQSYGRADNYRGDQHRLADIIVMCVKRLESMGYDEEKRQELYQTINEKNRRRGYLENER